MNIFTGNLSPKKLQIIETLYKSCKNVVEFLWVFPNGDFSQNIFQDLMFVNDLKKSKTHRLKKIYFR